MVELWGRCEVAKIQVKPGVLNTSSERMAEELKVRGRAWQGWGEVLESRRVGF